MGTEPRVCHSLVLCESCLLIKSWFLGEDLIKVNDIFPKYQQHIWWNIFFAALILHFNDISSGETESGYTGYTYINLRQKFSLCYDQRTLLILQIRFTVFPKTGLILGLRPANERRCYFVTTSLTGWAQAYSISPVKNYAQRSRVVVSVFWLIGLSLSRLLKGNRDLRIIASVLVK